MMRIDAHCHTDCSDGALSIESRIRMIKACGFDAATITDHDYISWEQVNRAKNACADLPYVPGIELSLRLDGKVVHLLGYYVDPLNEALQAHCGAVQTVDREHTRRLLSYFQGKGARFTLEDLVAPSLHTFYSLMLVKRVARDLYENNPGICLDAFDAAMSELGFAYPDLAPWEVRPAIDLIHQAGGIAVLAHPGGQDDRVMHALHFMLFDEARVKSLIGWGLDGIETSHPSHNREENHAYQKMAKKYGLLATAGSDCHGDDPYLGAALMGKFTGIPKDSYDRLSVYHQSGKTTT